MKKLILLLLLVVFTSDSIKAQHEYDKFKFCNYIFDFSKSEPVLDSNDLHFMDYSDGTNRTPFIYSFISDSNGDELIYFDDINLSLGSEIIYQDFNYLLSI